MDDSHLDQWLSSMRIDEWPEDERVYAREEITRIYTFWSHLLSKDRAVYRKRLIYIQNVVQPFQSELEACGGRKFVYANQLVDQLSRFFHDDLKQRILTHELLSTTRHGNEKNMSTHLCLDILTRYLYLFLYMFDAEKWDENSMAEEDRDGEMDGITMVQNDKDNKDE